MFLIRMRSPQMFVSLDSNFFSFFRVPQEKLVQFWSWRCLIAGVGMKHFITVSKMVLFKDWDLVLEVPSLS